MSLEQIVKESKPVLTEAIIVLFISSIIISNYTFTDINFHDNFVLPIISECHSNNVSTFCEGLREKFDCSRTDQLCLGKAYWQEQQRQVIWIGFALFTIRMSFGYMLQKYLHKKIRGTTILMAIIWGSIATIMFSFGLLDSFYFVFQGKEIPETLSWLNNNGVFIEIAKWSGTIDNVEATDLYYANLAGIILIGQLIFILMYIYAHEGYVKRGIA